MTFPDAVLNVNKPSGMSSRQAVDLVKRLVRPAKVGHAGTLDPLASGVLLVCIGKATRLISFVQQMPKRYSATFLLGRESATEDVEGEVTLLPDPHIPSQQELEMASRSFVGTIEQRPPAYSALKVQGKRAYQLARAGKAVELAPRKVHVHALKVCRYEYPRLELEICCGAGTYVRSLGRDLAESLGTAAVMSELVRTAIGHFGIDSAVDPRLLVPAELQSVVLPPQSALANRPCLVLPEAEIQLLSHGLPVRCPDSSGLESVESVAAAVDQNGRLVAVLKRGGDDAHWPYINFVGKG